MVKYAPRKVYIRESGGYVELSYTEFCRCRESDQTYMDKLFIPIQGCLLEVVREQYTDFYLSLIHISPSRFPSISITILIPLNTPGYSLSFSVTIISLVPCTICHATS